MFTGNKNKAGDKQISPAQPAPNVGGQKQATDELKVDKDFKVYTDAKSSELVEVVNIATGKKVMIARVHVARLVKDGLAKEV